MSWGGNPQPQPQVTVTPLQALNDWHVKFKALEAAKEAESAARLLAFKLCFPNPKEGTNNYDLPDGYVLKGQHKITRKFIVPDNFTGPHPDKPATVLDAVEQLANELRRHSNEGAFVADRLIKYEASLSDGEYKKLPEDMRKVVDKYVVSKEATPSMKVEPPKQK